MNIIHIDRACTVLHLEETKKTKTRLSEQIKSILTPSVVPVIDLADLRLNSMGIGDLVNIRNTLVEMGLNEGDPVRLANVSPFNRDVLERVKLDTVFALFDTLEEAIQNGSSSSGST